MALCGLSFLASAQGNKTPYVILVSFDGFRYDYVSKYNLPNFKAFIRDGAAAEALIPSFPSKTFPNHYTLVTGLYPGHHGLVDNQFYDEHQNKPYTMKTREAVIDSTFYGGVPIWRLAKKNNIVSASYFWVGSEIPDKALQPEYFYNYDMSVPFIQRVDQVIDWLKLPEKERPHLITLYFSSPDTEAHRFGPDSQETERSLMSIDSLLGKLISGVERTHLPVNMILVSDHGMYQLTDKPETYIFIDELIAPASGLKVFNGGTQAHIYTRSDAQTDSLYLALKKVESGFSVFRQRDFHADWHYNHPRAGDVLMVAQPGKYILSGDRERHAASGNSGGTFGVHGYDPAAVTEMRGIFYAKGPNIRKATVPAFQNIHVYPLIASILGMKTGKIDGDAAVLKPILKK